LGQKADGIPFYIKTAADARVPARFLTMDPYAGNPFDSKTLHKYLYAGGDPVNALDPTCRASNEMRSFWKSAVAVSGVAVICGAAITWQVYKAKANERKLAADARIRFQVDNLHVVSVELYKSSTRVWERRRRKPLPSPSSYAVRIVVVSVNGTVRIQGT
jgi:hypothetical protein